jgi:hypothetical protein
MHGSGCVQTSRHIVFDEYSNFGADDTAEQKAKRTSALAAAVSALEQRSSALPKRNSASSTVIQAAASDTSYFVANAGVLDKASPYIQDRCTNVHGKRIKDVLVLCTIQDRERQDQELYRPGDLEYETSIDVGASSPMPLLLSSLRRRRRVPSVCVAISGSAPSVADIAAVTMQSILSLNSVLALLCYHFTIQRSIRLSLRVYLRLAVDVMGRLTTSDRLDIAQYIAQARDPRFAVELVTPNDVNTGHLVKTDAWSGARIVDGSFSAPIIAGPAFYDAAMSSPACREWLAAIYAEIKGQIAAGCWRWEVLSPGAHIAQLDTFKAQVGSTAELEGTIYSGD